MTEEPKPTPQDIENARVRQAIADRQAQEYAEAQQLAQEALGPGWTPWMRLVLIDADHRQHGNVQPVATAYKVYRGTERISENAVYLRRMPDGTARQASSYEPLFGELLHEQHPTRMVEVRGQRVPVGRYELCWSALERYAPRTAEQLAAARQKREERAIAKEAEAHPLFADQIRAGAFRGSKKPAGRSPG